MKNIINSYLEFINESNLILLLEANIQYLPNFKTVLDKIKSPISDELKKLVNKDIDINTNYIDINTEKNDYITFIPDDKIKNLKYTVISRGFYESLSYDAKKDGTYPIGDVNSPSVGCEGEIVHELTVNELRKIQPSFGWQDSDISGDNKIVHFRWSGGNILLKKSHLVEKLDDYKSTDFKVGKFVTKILTTAGVKFTPKDVEDFVDKYKSQMQLRKNVFSRFEIVSGDVIKKWYYLVNYESPSNGSLGGSCMRYQKCQTFFDIYIENTEVVSMVILKAGPKELVDEDTGEIYSVDQDLISGRAILWTDIRGRKIMDRIYTNNSADVELFKEFANKNGFYYKKEQDFNEYTPFVFDGKIITNGEDNNIVVQLKRGFDYDYYPYMDTLKYYNSRTGIITNDSSERYDHNLEDTDGGRGCQVCDGTGLLGCPECEGSGTEECYECDGEGTQVCEFCDGDGECDCPECDGNDPDCEMCHGKNKVECPECNGDCTEECRKCEGSGRITCTVCDGDEEVSCPECQ